MSVSKASPAVAGSGQPQQDPDASDMSLAGRIARSEAKEGKGEGK